MYKNYEKAREMLLKAVETSENGNAYYFLGEIEKIEGNYEKAREYYQKAITKNISKKFLKLAYWNLIVLTERKGDYPEMVKSLKIFWEKTKDSGAKNKVETLINKLMWSNNDKAVDLYKKGIELKERKEKENAESRFREAIQEDPSYLAPKFELGMIEYNKDNLREALYYFKQVADKIPFYGEIQLMVGDIYFKEKSYSYALEYFSNSLEYGFLSEKTRHTILLKRGTCYYNTRDYANAKSDILDACDIKETEEAYFLLSAIYIKEEDYKNALKTLKDIRKTNKNNPEISFQIGSIYYKMEDKKYITYFSELFDLVNKKEKNVPEKYYKAFIILLKDYFEKSSYKKVITILDTLPDDFKNHEVKIISARSYFYLNNFSKAIEYFENSYLENEDNFLLCKAYAKTENKEKTKEILNKLYYDETYFNKALEDQTLKNIAEEIKKERTTKTETQ